MKIIEKFLSFVFSLAIFGWIAAPIHEGFHLLASRSFGVDGRIGLAWGGYGTFQPDSFLSPGGNIIMLLAGGLGTGLVFLILWMLAAYQAKYTKWELDDASALFLVMAMQFTYAPIDAFWPSAPNWIIAVSALAAFGATGAIYGKALIEWIAAEEKENKKVV